MRKRFEWKWEVLENNPATHTKRSKIVGGWLVHHSTVTTKGNISESMVFVPDRDHEWHILPPINPNPLKEDAQIVSAEFARPKE